ncbi:MAG: 16S rRNA (uracil(1498)-N(3))-methyltransferase [Acidobacteria bacterium]|nr:16S rRNA (uracil(1498)-N(3))-methyltransferase [Acidobacteriota bacterium]
MTRRRFYATPEAFAPDGVSVTLSAEESRHLRDVLRLREGDEAFVFDGEGHEFACAVRALAGRGGSVPATLEVRGPVEPQRPESPLSLTLAVALLKGEKFDLVVQKATELGASRIVPVLTVRADVRPHDARDASRRVERWRRLALEATKQSGRARVPEISEPFAFASFVETQATGEAGRRVMFVERGGHGRVAPTPIRRPVLTRHERVETLDCCPPSLPDAHTSLAAAPRKVLTNRPARAQNIFAGTRVNETPLSPSS